MTSALRIDDYDEPVVGRSTTINDQDYENFRDSIVGILDGSVVNIDLDSSI